MVLEYLEEAWDAIVDGFHYLISFEWGGDLMEFFGGMFENLSEFSFVGLIMGILAAGMIYMLRKQMLNPFLVYMGSAEAIFWGGLTYLGALAGGYFVGKKLFDE